MMKAGASGSITLQTLIDGKFKINGRELETLERLEIAKQIASLTQELHSNGKVNFNFNPSNFDISFDADNITVRRNEKFSQTQKQQRSTRILKVSSITSLREREPDYVPPEYIHPSKKDANDTYNIMYFDKADIWRMGKLFERLNLPIDLQPMLNENSDKRPDTGDVLSNILNSIVTIQDKNADAVKQEAENIEIMEMIKISGKLTKLKDQLLDNISQNQDTKNFASELDSILDELNPYLTSENVRIKNYAQAIKDDPFGVDDIIDLYGYYELIQTPNKLFDLEQNAIIFSNPSNLDLLRFSKEQQEKLIKAVQPALTVALARQEAELKEAEAQRVADEEAALEQHRKDLAAKIAPAAAKRANEIQSEKDRLKKEAAELARKVEEKRSFDAMPDAEKMKVESDAGQAMVQDLIKEYEPNDTEKELFGFLELMIKNDADLAIALYNNAANQKRLDQEGENTPLVKYMLDIVKERIVFEQALESTQDLKSIDIVFSDIQQKRMAAELEAQKKEFLSIEGSLKSDDPLKEKFNFIRRVNNLTPEDTNKTLYTPNNTPDNPHYTLLSKSDMKAQYWPEYAIKHKDNIEALASRKLLESFPRFNFDLNQMKENLLTDDRELTNNELNKLRFIAVLQAHILSEKSATEKYGLEPTEENKIALIKLVNKNKASESNALLKFDSAFQKQMNIAVINDNHLNQIASMDNLTETCKNLAIQELHEKYSKDDTIELPSMMGNYVTLAFLELEAAKVKQSIEQDPVYIQKRNIIRGQIPGLQEEYQEIENQEITQRESILDQERALRQSTKAFLSLWKSEGKKGFVLDDNEIKAKEVAVLEDYKKLIIIYQNLITNIPESEHKTKATKILANLNTHAEEIQKSLDSRGKPDSTSALSRAIEVFTSALSTLKELATACFPGKREEKKIHNAADELEGHPKESKASKPKSNK